MKAPVTVAEIHPPEVHPPANLTVPERPPSEPQETPPARTEPENVTPLPAPIAPELPKVTLNAGVLIPVRLVDGLSSARNHVGDTFAATLYRELVAGDFVIAERGARVEGRVVAAGRDALSLELVRIHLSDNQDLTIETESFAERAAPDHRRDAEALAAGTFAGAVAGGLAGGAKGAAIGAGAGGAAGAGLILATRPAAQLSPETRIAFRLRAPVTIIERH